MVDKLYVIGNGFDIHHGINSSYKCYMEWLKDKHKDVYVNLLKYYPQAEDDEWWGDFENNLGLPDIHDYLSNTADFYQPSEDDIEKMRAIDDTGGEFDVHNELGGTLNDVRNTFHDWILSLNHARKAAKLNIDTDNSLFLNFNYTKTLEDIYGIHEANILHIHGSIDDDEFILGHGEDKKSIEDRLDPQEEWDGISDPSEFFGFHLHDSITEKTIGAGIEEIFSLRKDVMHLISKNKEFWNKLKNVKHVYIFGISFSKVDEPYLIKITDSVLPTATYVISYYSKNDIERINNFIATQKITNYEYVKLSDLAVNRQLDLFE